MEKIYKCVLSLNHYGDLMNALKLKLSMIGTLGFMIMVSTLFFTILLSLTGAFEIYTLALFVVLINVIQWLIAPYLIDAMYQVRKVSRSEEPELYEMVDGLSKKSRIRTPQLMIAKIPIPNAFAYGSPLAGNRVAVTTGLLNTLDNEEIEAVIGHELGHLKNKDVQVMMFVSILPALLYYIGYTLMWSSAYSRRDERGSQGGLALIGILSVILSWILTLFTFYLSRIREYFADRHSASIVDEGARKLSEGLAKITEWTERTKGYLKNHHRLSSLKALFICDPDSARRDLMELYQTQAWKGDSELVTKYLSRKLTIEDQIAELFSTHPNLVKRLKALQELA